MAVARTRAQIRNYETEALKAKDIRNYIAENIDLDISIFGPAEGSLANILRELDKVHDEGTFIFTGFSRDEEGNTITPDLAAWALELKNEEFIRFLMRHNAIEFNPGHYQTLVRLGYTSALNDLLESNPGNATALYDDLFNNDRAEPNFVGNLLTLAALNAMDKPTDPRSMQVIQALLGHSVPAIPVSDNPAMTLSALDAVALVPLETVDASTATRIQDIIDCISAQTGARADEAKVATLRQLWLAEPEEEVAAMPAAGAGAA